MFFTRIAAIYTSAERDCSSPLYRLSVRSDSSEQCNVVSVHDSTVCFEIWMEGL
jgi:hypothetical protein